MAVDDYRYRIPGGQGNEPEIALNGYVHFDVFVERCTAVDPDVVWEQIQLGHLTVPVHCASLEGCTSAGEAKQLIADMILERGITQAHQARQALIALLPGGTWPEDDITHPIEV